jgi:hypothetical protein
MGKVARPRIVSKAEPGRLPRARAGRPGRGRRRRSGWRARALGCLWTSGVAEIMAADVARICGSRGKHTPDREVYRHGTEPRFVPLGGALVQVERPRMRSKDRKQVALPSYELFAHRDLLGEIALGRMLAGLPPAGTGPGRRPRAMSS